jgi:hypothetical protein
MDNKNPPKNTLCTGTIFVPCQGTKELQVLTNISVFFQHAMAPNIAPKPLKEYMDFWMYNAKSQKPKQTVKPRMPGVSDPACAGGGVPLLGIHGSIKACAEITEAYAPGSKMQFYYVDNVKEVIRNSLEQLLTCN